jgi:hypothetical protein
MSLNFVVQPGKIFVTDEKVNTSKLNQLGVPVIQAEGVISASDMGAGDYSGVLTPGAYLFAAATLSGAAYTTAFDPVVTTYADGLVLAFKPDATNPANPTLDAGPGAKPLYQYGASTPVEAGDLPANRIVEVRYNSALNVVDSVALGGWEVMSLIGPRPVRNTFGPASAYLGGEMGFVPAPAASSTRKYLRDDGTWSDPVAAAVAATNGGALELFKQQQFI